MSGRPVGVAASSAGSTVGISRRYPGLRGWGAAEATSCGSAEIAGFQGGVGLIDDLELLLGGLVAAMRVGVVELDEHLVPGLQADRGERGLEVKDGKRLLAGGGCAGALFAAGGRTVAPRPAGSARRARVEPEGVVDARAIGRTMALTQFPGRPLPNRI